MNEIEKDGPMIEATNAKITNKYIISITTSEGKYFNVKALDGGGFKINSDMTSQEIMEFLTRQVKIMGWDKI